MEYKTTCVCRARVHAVEGATALQTAPRICLPGYTETIACIILQVITIFDQIQTYTARRMRSEKLYYAPTNVPANSINCTLQLPIAPPQSQAATLAGFAAATSVPAVSSPPVLAFSPLLVAPSPTVLLFGLVPTPPCLVSKWL